MAAAFDRVANGIAPPAYPGLPTSAHIRTIPPSLLKAVGWVESGWRQFAPRGIPLLSPDFGYGIMQVTSGMDGAFGRLHGTIDEASQSSIASDYQFNIAYGARILAQKWASTPRIGSGDPTVLENWYFALWAYNGWGWVNNPNNPRFSRLGTPAMDPTTYPYQERVLYLVAHPPRDHTGNPLWKAVPVSLPTRASIGTHPHAYVPALEHRQPVPAASAVYQPAPLRRSVPGQSQPVSVTVVNTGTSPWLSSGGSAVSLTYHLFGTSGNPWQPLSPFTSGVLAFGQSPIVIPHDVLPGAAVKLRVPVQAPQKSGTYRVVWDVEQGATTWFSQEGIPPRVETLHVGNVPPPPAATPTPSLTPVAAESMHFIRDTSFPDGTAVGSHNVFEKGWLVFNSGVMAWQSGYKLVLTSGRSFGASTIAVPATRPCQTVDVFASLRAPTASGQYSGVWRMRDPLGHNFGDRLTVRIAVAGPHTRPTPTPVSTPFPTPPAHPRPTATATPTG